MKSKRITFLTSIGAGLEYYDFVIFAMLAGYLSQKFFPNTNHYAALMETFAVFAVGYIVRPLGGVIFGVLGDRFGRKNVFLSSILLMSVATLLMGLVPSYESIGISATVIFTLLRVLQGISIGAELPGSLTFLSEHVGEKHRGTHCGFMVSSIGIGASLGSFIIYILTEMLTKNEILSWGWRIPFLIGSIVGLIGFFIRKNTTETPCFEQQKEHPKFALFELLKKYPKQTVFGIGIVLFPISFIIFFLCMPSFLHDVYGYKVSDICLLMTIGYIWSAILIPIFGWLSDYVTRKRLLFVSVLCFIVFGFPFFGILAYKSSFALIAFLLLYQTLIAAMAGCYFAMLPENFPTSVRFTGVAFCYNIACLCAAFVPMAANYILKQTQMPEYISLLLIAIAIITAICTILMKNCTRCELN